MHIEHIFEVSSSIKVRLICLLFIQYNPEKKSMRYVGSKLRFFFLLTNLHRHIRSCPADLSEIDLGRRFPEAIPFDQHGMDRCAGFSYNVSLCTTTRQHPTITQ